MPGSPTPVKQPPSPSPEVQRVPGISDLTQSREAALARDRKKMNKDAARRIVDNEARDLLAEIRAATKSAKEGKEILAMATWSGSEREDALRLSLRELEAAAATTS